MLTEHPASSIILPERIDAPLLNHLAGIPQDSGINLALPKYLDFGWSKPAVQKLLQNGRLVPVKTEEEKRKFAASVQEDIENPKLADIQEVIREVSAIWLAEQDFGERGLAVSMKMDSFDNVGIEFSPPIFGTHKSMLMQNRLMPYKVRLLEIHTHPDDSLFSAKDVYPLFVDTRNLTGRKRLLYATMVVGPTMQFLAFATPETPVYSIDDANKVLQQIEQNRNDEYLRLLKDLTKEEPPEELMIELVINNKVEVMNLIQQMKMEINSGILTANQARERLKAFIGSKGDTGRMFVEYDLEEKKTRNLIEEHLALQMMQQLGIELYVSNNHEQFARSAITTYDA